MEVVEYNQKEGSVRSLRVEYMNNKHNTFRFLRNTLVVLLCLGMMVTSLTVTAKARTIDHSYDASNYDNTKKFDEKDIEFEITEDREEYANTST